MKQEPQFGQWIGKFSGEASPAGATVIPGNATFSIEYDRPNFGFACIDQGDQIHGSRENFNIKIDGNKFSGRAVLTSAFDWQTNEVISVEESINRQRALGKDLFYASELEVHDGIIENQILQCTFSGSYKDIKLKGRFEGHKLSQNEPSQPNDRKSWEEFKVYVSKLIKDGREFIFRGQPSNQHRLNTTFHRERRYDLLRYETEACEQLVQHINAISARQYDRKNPIEFGALLSLAQHHGFPILC